MKKLIIFLLIFWSFSFLDAQNCSQSNLNLDCFNNYGSNSSSVGCSTSNNNNELLPDLTVSWWMMQEFLDSRFGKGPLEYPNKDRLGVDLLIPNIGKGPMISVAKGEFVCVDDNGNIQSDCTTICNTGNCNDPNAIVTGIDCPCDPELQKEKVFQRIFVKDGNTISHYDQDIGFQSFHNAADHDHYHLDNWINLTLRIKDDSKPSPCDWEIVSNSSKIGFCLGDTRYGCLDQGIYCYSNTQPTTDDINLHNCPEDFPNLNLAGPFYLANCNSVSGLGANLERRMGISPGRADLYSKHQTDNWVDLPVGICNKEFWLVAEVNTDRSIKEENYTNNCVAIPYQLKHNLDENTNIIENIHKSYCDDDGSISLSVQKNHQLYSLRTGYLETESGYPNTLIENNSLSEDIEPRYSFIWPNNLPGESIKIYLDDLDEDANGQKIPTYFSVDVSNGNELFPELENYCNVSTSKYVVVYPEDFSDHSIGLIGTIYPIGNYSFTGTHYLTSNIVVENDCVLTISDAIVHFDEDAGIIVKPGGRVNIERSVLKNFPCNDLPWNGIFVDGNTDFPHPNNILPPPEDYISLAAAHGILTITDSEVRNARIGISNFDDVKDNTEGGIIIAKNTQFINNQKSLAITSPINGHNATSVYNCNFYNMEEFFPNDTYSYPEHNYDPSNKEYRQIELKNARNISIQNCQFKSIGNKPIDNINTNFQVTGIHSNISSFIIGDTDNERKNYFKNLYKGIDIYDNYSLSGDKIVLNNLFNHVRKNITLNNGVLYEVSNNKIYNLPTGGPDLKQSYGIYSFETFGTNLKNNIIHKKQGVTFSFGLILEDGKSINANPTDFTVVNSNRFMGFF